MKALQDLLGVELALIQAPMAGVQGSELALAVSKAGALGSLPGAMLSAAALREELGRLNASSRSYNVNFFCHTPPTTDPAVTEAWVAVLRPYYEELGLDPRAIPQGPSRTPFSAEVAAILTELRPPVVSFHFGLPAPELLASVRAAGARVLSTATTVEEALWLEARGVDAIIAQGLEAGGHRGHFLSGDLTLQMGTLALVRQVVEVVQIPVIAAGGVADAEGAAAARALGAAGVQVGTAFLLCPEATTSAVHRAALQSTSVRHTALTTLFSGGAARGLVNRLMRELGPLHLAAPPFPLASAASAPLRAKAERESRGDFSPLWAGQSASACRTLPAAEIVRSLTAGLNW